MGGLLPGETGALTPPEPWIPLAVALALGNLAPRMQFLDQFEKKLREKTHEMMGIPTGLVEASERIEGADLTLEGIGPRFVTEVDRVRLDEFVATAQAEFGAGAKVDRFERVMIKLIAFRSWVLDDNWPAQKIRARYRAIERELGQDIDALMLDLAQLVEDSERNQHRESAGTAVPELPREGTLHSRWDARMQRASKLCIEVCALMFVYADQERGHAPQRPEAVEAFLGRVYGRTNQCPHLDIVVNCLVFAVLIAFTWGVAHGVMGRSAVEGHFAANAINGLLYGLSALFIYGPSMLAVLWWRRRHDRRTTADADQVFSARRYVVVFAGCAAASFAVLVPYDVTQALMRDGLPGNVGGITSGGEVLLRAVGYAVQKQSLFAVLGGLQGVFVAAYLSLGDDQLAGWPAKALVTVNGLVLFGWAQTAGMTSTSTLSGIIGLAIGSLMVVTLHRLRAQSRGGLAVSAP